jgi:ABC-type microcin C transport system duplicated ATPase subunit YejF
MVVRSHFDCDDGSEAHKLNRTSYLSRDVGVVRHVAEQVELMRLGEIVELGEPEVLYDMPTHVWRGPSLMPELDDTDSPRRERIITRVAQATLNSMSGGSTKPSLGFRGLGSLPL